MGTFADEIAKWAQTVQDRMQQVFRVAVTKLGEEMARSKYEGGATPKDVGNLIRSLLANVNGPVYMYDAKEFAGTDVGLAVAGAVLGDSVTLGFQANYAHRQNFGFVGEDKLGRYYNQAGSHFVERAAAMWPQFVDQAVREVKANG